MKFRGKIAQKAREITTCSPGIYDSGQSVEFLFEATVGTVREFLVTAPISGIPIVCPPPLYSLTPPCFATLLGKRAAGEKFWGIWRVYSLTPPLFRNTSETRGGSNYRNSTDSPHLAALACYCPIKPLRFQGRHREFQIGISKAFSQLDTKKHLKLRGHG